MKILASSLACSPFLGSEALVGFKTMEALASHHDVRLVTSKGMEGPSGFNVHEVSAEFSDPNDVAAGELLRFERMQRSALHRIVNERTFDVFHRVTPSGYKDTLLPVPSMPLVLGPVLGVDPLPPGFASVFRPQLPWSYSSFEALSARIQNGIARRIFARRGTLSQLLERATLILVGTQVTLRQLSPQLQSKCRSIPYAGVEHELFCPPVRDRRNKVPQLLFAGRLVPYKGVELLLRAVALAKVRCEFELTIVGGGYQPFIRHYQQLATRLGLSDSVRFLPNQPRSNLVSLYQSADIFCMPSIETYGMAILEAMSSGCAVLVSDINGPGEIVQSGTGLKVPLESPEKFIEGYAERIVQLAEDSMLREELGQNARERVVQHHDWKQIQSQLLQIYEETFSDRSFASQKAHLPVPIA